MSLSIADDAYNVAFYIAVDDGASSPRASPLSLPLTRRRSGRC